MKRAAIGIRVHSGWGAVVAVSGMPGGEEVIDRRRVAVADPRTTGAIQPYHFAERMELKRAEQHIAKCAAASRKLAVAAVRALLRDLEQRQYSIVGTCILLSSGRALPEFDKILASHALIHTAEGEFFREAFRGALGECGVPVIGVRERELQVQAESRLGPAAAKLQEKIAAMGRSLGPPWTADQKNAALAAFLVLY